MHTTIQKTTAVLAAVLTIGLISGNVFSAEARADDGVISAADLAFIKAGYKGADTGGVADDQAKPAGLVSAADDAFMRSPFTKLSGHRQAREGTASIGIITAADYRFMTAGPVEDVFSAYSDLADSRAGQPAR